MLLFQTMMPVYIRSLHYDGSVLELAADETCVECNPLNESKSEYQQWYIKYLTGLRDGIFMIISKKSGKALQMDGEEVKAAECDEQEQRQQWRRDGLHILTEKRHFLNKLSLCVRNIKNCLLVGAGNSTAMNTCFELQHIVVDSYF